MTSYNIGRLAGYDRRVNEAQLRGLRLQNDSNELALKKKANQVQIENFKLSEILVEDSSIKGGYRIDKTKFNNPGEILDFLQTYLPEITEYGVYDDAGQLQGYEKMVMENILAKADDAGKMKYLISGRRPDGKRGFFDRKRRKGESENGGDPADITGVTLDVLLNVAGRRMLSSATNASNFADASVLSRYVPPAMLAAEAQLKQEAGSQLAVLSENKRLIDVARDAKKRAGKNKDEFLQIIEETLSDPQLKGTGAIFELLKDAEQLWIALGGDPSDIVGDNQMASETAGVSGLSSSQDGIPQDELLLNETEEIDDRGPNFRFTGREELGVDTLKNAPEGYVVPTSGAETTTTSSTTAPIDTGVMTRYGRKRWQDPITGEYYSEKTKTFQTPDGRWINVPSVDENGQIIPDQVLEDRINKENFMDPVTGEELPLFRSLELAEGAAGLRSRTMKQAIDAEDPSALREMFTEEGVKNLEEAMAYLQDVLETDFNALGKAQRLIAGMTSDPAAAMAEMERFNISGFRSTASKLDPYIPETKPVEYSERVNTAKTTIEGIRFSRLMQNPNEDEYGFGYQDAGTGEFYSIKDLIAEVRGLTESQADPDMRGRSQAQIDSDMNDIIDGSRAVITAAAVQNGEETSYTDRVTIGGLFGGERWYASDAAKDLINTFFGGRANFNRDSLSGQKGNMRLLVGPGTAEEGGADISGLAGRTFNYPRIAFFDNGKETKASLDLGSIISMYPGNPKAAMEVLAQMVPEEDLARYDYNQLVEFYKNFIKAAGEYKSDEEVEKRRNPMPTENYVPQIGPF